MKILMFAAAIAAGMSAFAIESDIVGYTTDGITKGNYNMIAVPFVDVGGAEGFSLNKNLTVTGAKASDDSSAADQIKIWDPAENGYATYYLYEGDDDYPFGWYNYVTDENFDDEYPNGLPAGTAVWYLAKAGASEAIATASGAVESDDEVSVVLTKGNYNMVGNPFPLPLKLNDANYCTLVGAKASDDSSAADQIKIWDPAENGYATYYLYEGDDDYPFGWYNYVTDDGFEDDYPNGMKVNGAFWYSAKAGEGKITMTFKK